METSMPMPDRAQIRRSRVQLVMIVLLFLLPPIGAWVAWQYVGQEGVDATTNAGTLVSPARPLAVAGLIQADGTTMGDAALRGRWTYVLFAPAGCDDRCRQQLYLTRQVRLAMNKDIPRVQRLLVLSGEPGAALAQQLATEHKDLHWVVGAADARSLLDRFQGPGFGTGGAQFFLVDPLGNLMMHYDLAVPAKGVIKDLQKLLKVSQIG